MSGVLAACLDVIMRPPLPFFLSAVLAVVVSSSSGCSQTSPPAHPVTAELSTLTSSMTHLIYPPFLRSEPAPPADQGYDARTAALLGLPTTASLAGQRRAELQRHAAAFGPVTGRWLLLPLLDAFRPWLASLPVARALGQIDARCADRTANCAADRAVTVDRAVELAMATKNTTLLQRLRHDTPWLKRTAASPDLDAAAAAAHALHLLGRPVPVNPRAQAPDAASFPNLTAAQREALLQQTYDVVRLQQASAEHVDLDVTSWLHVLDANASTLSAAMLYQLTTVLRGGGVPHERLGAITRRLQNDRLPDGLYRDPSSYVGDPTTTLYALALRSDAGETLVDPTLASGAAEFAKQQSDHTDAGTDFLLSSITALTAGKPPSPQSPCEDTSPIGLDDVPGWAFVGMVCQLDGTAIATPSFVRWPTDTPHGLVEAATVVVTLSAAGHEADIPAWVRAGLPAGLAPAAVQLQKVAGLAHAATIVGALRDLHGTVPPALLHAVAAQADGSRGCPGYPDLYRAVPDEEFSCDLVTTLAVRRYLLTQPGEEHRD